MTQRSEALRPALFAGLGVTVALVALSTLSAFFGFIASTAYSLGRLGGGYLSDGLNPFDLRGLIIAFFTVQVAMGAGVFLSLWLIAPIRAGASIVQVVLRSILAAAVGAVIVLVLSLFVNLGQMLYAGGLTPGLGGFWSFASSLIAAFGTATGALVTSIPLAVVAGLGIVLWRARARLTEPPIVG
jgi:hypothetical protein